MGQDMEHSVHPVLITLLIISLTTLVEPALAFDDDKNISDVSLKDESFLDINAHAFRKSLDLTWFNTLNGWRMGGGSTSTNRAFLQTDIRMNQQLSRNFQFGIDWQYEQIYAPAAIPLPLVFADVYPLSGYDVGVSFLGTPAHDKRQSDLGYALTIGRKPTDYLRFSWLKVDMTYNDKNEFDDSYYEKTGRLLMLQGAYRVNSAWEVHLDMKKDTPLDFVFDDQTSHFEHEGYDYKLHLIYRRSAHQVAGINYLSNFVDKHLLESSSDRQQQIEYKSWDIYWIENHFRKSQELTVGLRYDNFLEQLHDVLNNSEDYEFSLTTWQAYTSLFYSYATHQAWDAGLYLGWSERSKTFLLSNPASYDDEGIQSKLRLSWQYHSLDKASVLLISMSFNLDDLRNDPGDGGGRYFQNQF